MHDQQVGIPNSAPDFQALPLASPTSGACHERLAPASDTTVSTIQRATSPWGLGGGLFPQIENPDSPSNVVTSGTVNDLGVHFGNYIEYGVDIS